MYLSFDLLIHDRSFLDLGIQIEYSVPFYAEVFSFEMEVSVCPNESTSNVQALRDNFALVT